MNDKNKWIRIRKELYLQMEKQVRRLLGEDTPELMHYHKVYQSNFSKNWSVGSTEELWARIAITKVLFVGDFHALHQSQKAQMRILRNIPKERDVVLAVEFFESSDQKIIDQYMSGVLGERDFLVAIQWEKKWGFPWENYRPLIRYAQKNKIPVYGINKSAAKRTAASLKNRDIFAAKKIVQIQKAHAESLIFVIYGDLHLAKQHIPRELMKLLGASSKNYITRILQNSEKVYFEMLHKNSPESVDLVRLDESTFCLLSVAPWVKWQNYLMYLEQTYDEGLVGFVRDDDSDDDDFDDDDSDSLDYTDHVSRYVSIIADELGVEVSLSGLSVYTARDSGFWTSIEEKYDFKIQKWIEALIADEVSFYLPEVGVAYLSRGTVNHAAALAMQYVHSQLGGRNFFRVDMPQDFLRWIWLEAVSYFGSKMINHKRKADTIFDIKASLSHRSPQDLRREALRLALAQKMHELMIITGVSQSKLTTKPKRKISYQMAASLLGSMMGDRLYFGYQKKLVNASTLISFLKKPVDNENFDVAYYGLLEFVESLPAPFKSKKEQL